MNKVARHGDYSPRSFLEMELNDQGFNIRCVIDQERHWEAPNPKFCPAFAGGRSLEVYRVLWVLYNELPTDQHQRAFVESSQGEGSRFIILRKDDMIVATEDVHGEYGASVFVGSQSLHFPELKRLYDAISNDNKKEPLWDALAPKV
jgi:hypothetical protein